MRLKEERTLFAVEVVMLCFVVIFSILLQFTDAKIQDYKDNFIAATQAYSKFLLLTIYHRQDIAFFDLNRSLNQLNKEGTLHLQEDPTLKSENYDKELIELMNKYKTNTIDANTYLFQRGVLAREKQQQTAYEVKNIENVIENLLKNPPKILCFSTHTFRSICLVSQIIGASIAIILFIKLFLGVNRRIAD